MVQAVDGAHALQKREVVPTKLARQDHWRTVFIGQYGAGKLGDDPQAYLVEMHPGEELPAHFHHVDQFQVFVQGDGRMGRGKEDVSHPILVHYADHHTGYGPIFAGGQGFSYFTLRARTDAGAVWLHEPGYRDKLRPSPKRHMSRHVTLSTDPVLLNMKEPQLENLVGESMDTSDGLAAFALRVGPGLAAMGPDPKGSDGQFYVVFNGSLEYAGGTYGKLSTIFVERGDKALEFRAGPQGVETLVLQYPRVAATGG